MKSEPRRFLLPPGAEWERVGKYKDSRGRYVCMSRVTGKWEWMTPGEVRSANKAFRRGT